MLNLDTCQRIFCVGRNYLKHIEELSNETPSSPVIFMKPASSLVPLGRPITMPQHGQALHHEAEVVVQIGHKGRAHSKQAALDMISGITLGIDLTLRDVQSTLKYSGLPWEVSKAFDDSAPIGTLTPYTQDIDLGNLSFKCRVNEKLRQHGNTQDMLHPIDELIMYISSIWSLLPGDLIYTGTPEGVSQFGPGDNIEISHDTLGTFSWDVR